MAGSDLEGPVPGAMRAHVSEACSDLKTERKDLLQEKPGLTGEAKTQLLQNQFGAWIRGWEQRWGWGFSPSPVSPSPADQGLTRWEPQPDLS